MSDKYMKSVYMDEAGDSQKPNIMVFPNNFPNLEEINDADSTKWMYFQNKDKKFKEDKMLLGENEKISYEGKSKMNNNMSE
jgi:hypothetical protein